MSDHAENAKQGEMSAAGSVAETAAKQMMEEVRSAGGSMGAKTAGEQMGEAIGEKKGSGGLPGLMLEHMNKLDPKEGLSLTDDIARALKDGGKLLLDKWKFPSPKDGVQQLSTGDYLVREDGKQTLFTPNGDRVTVNPNGTYDIKGDVNSVKTDKFGRTTVEFADGSSASFDHQGFLSVSRDGQAVHFGRRAFPPVLKPHYYGPDKGPGSGSSLEEFISRPGKR